MLIPLGTCRASERPGSRAAARAGTSAPNLRRASGGGHTSASASPPALRAHRSPKAAALTPPGHRGLKAKDLRRDAIHADDVRSDAGAHHIHDVERLLLCACTLYDDKEEHHGSTHQEDGFADSA
jgi:hypothetical protein